jgi:single-stranded-DNA-specific exonuclease
MKDQWNIPETDRQAAMDLARNSGVSPVAAGLLIQRGFLSPETVSDFLNPSLEALRSPFLLKDIETAAGRIAQAVMEKENILVFGDYDVDGVTGTLILYEFLKHCGATVSYHIPHRIKEGYSFKARHVTELLKPANIRLLITVDCGSDSHDAMDLAAEHGVDVVITDHHSVTDSPPRAVAVVNPKRNDCDAGLDHLAGVGVAFYVLIALRKTLRELGFWKTVPEPNLKNACDLVALGTIADIVPLLHENRILTKVGLDIINTRPRPGIKALMDVGKLNKNIVNAEDIAFRIAPRLNAAGRINHADLAFRLLSSTSDKEAKALAKSLDELNGTRQSIEQQIFDEAESYLEKTAGAKDKPAIILHRQGWHLGVLGIVAAKLSKKHHKPVVLITFDGDTGKGSGRSVPGIHLFDALSSCSDSLKGFGGHAMAGGLEIKKEKLYAFHHEFNAYVAKITSETPLVPQLDIHSHIHFDDIKPGLLDELEKFQPFGSHNPEPLFIASDVDVVSALPVGERHRRLVLTSRTGETDASLMAMHFQIKAGTDYPGCFKHLVFRIQWNRWNNTKSPQIIIEDFI